MIGFGKYFIYAWLLLLFIACNNKVSHTEEVQLKVMSFNIWHGGGKSLNATAKVFVESKADIIGLQESSRDGKNMAVHIADSLGWYSYVFSDSETIISKYPIVDTSENKYGEVHDRIDFVMYSGSIKPKLSQILGEKSQFTDITFDDYPSNHRAVISIFLLNRSK